MIEALYHFGDINFEQYDNRLALSQYDSTLGLGQDALLDFKMLRYALA